MISEFVPGTCISLFEPQSLLTLMRLAWFNQLYDINDGQIRLRTLIGANLIGLLMSAAISSTIFIICEADCHKASKAAS